MDTLKTLIRLNEKKIEDKQKEIAELNRVIEQMEDRKIYLQQSIEDELEAAVQSNDPTSFAAAGHFMNGADFEIRDIDEALIDAEKIMAEKRNAIHAMYMEQKRYDILYKRHQEKVKKAHDKAAQDQLDEIALLRYNRPA